MIISAGTMLSPRRAGTRSTIPGMNVYKEVAMRASEAVEQAIEEMLKRHNIDTEYLKHNENMIESYLEERLFELRANDGKYELLFNGNVVDFCQFNIVGKIKND
jgi:hypothetical protein